MTPRRADCAPQLSAHGERQRIGPQAAPVGVVSDTIEPS
jgi:hypothetical protein